MEQMILFMAKGFGSGWIKRAPGTWGSLLACILAYFFPVLITIPVIFITAIGGVYLCTKAEKLLGLADPGEINFDEMVGMWCALYLVPHTPLFYLVAFALFRLFDIVKPGPIDIAQHLPKGWGIMADDILAGGFAGGIIYALLWVASYIL